MAEQAIAAVKTGASKIEIKEFPIQLARREKSFLIPNWNVVIIGVLNRHIEVS